MKHIIQCLRKIQSFWMLKQVVDLMQQVTAYDHTWKENARGSNSVVGYLLQLPNDLFCTKSRRKPTSSENHSIKWAQPYLWLRPKEESNISECMPSFVVLGCTFSSACFEGPVVQLKGNWFLLYNSVLSQLNLTYHITVYYFLRIHFG
jgi:hypothetical protein